jgi:hypothetical protein
MKNNIEIIVIVGLFAFLAIRLYQRFIKKDAGQNSPVKKSGTSFASSSKDDDYEPYAKK